MFETTKLFQAGESGYKTYRIPALTITDDGTVLAFCAARVDPGDWSTIDIALRRDMGREGSWSPMRIVASQGVVTDNPVPIFDSDANRLHFLYQVDYTEVYYTFSDSAGETFAEPVDITSVIDTFKNYYPWRVVAPGPGHGLLLRNGRLLVPIWMSDGSGTEMGPGNLGHRPSVVAMIYSDDQGQTWAAGEIILRHDGDVILNPSEHVVVELTDGRVMSNIRSESKRYRRITTTSNDGVSNWSEARFDEALFEPICMASLIRVSWNPSILLFVNPDSRKCEQMKNAMARYPRQNLTAKLSFDEGKTWPVSRAICQGVSGYSDLAIAADGTVYCLFEHGGEDNEKGPIRNQAMSLAHFDLSWLTNGS